MIPRKKSQPTKIRITETKKKAVRQKICNTLWLKKAFLCHKIVITIGAPTIYSFLDLSTFLEREEVLMRPFWAATPDFGQTEFQCPYSNLQILFVLKMLGKLYGAN